MREYRYSLGLLELAFGVMMLLLALYIELTQLPETARLVRFLFYAAGVPLTFWITSKVQERLPEKSKLATFVPSRRTLLIAFTVCFCALIIPVTLFPRNPSTTPNIVAAVVAGALVMLGGTGPRVAYLVSATLLLGLGLAIFAPADHAAGLFCIIMALVLIPASIVTLRRELSG